MAEFIIDTNKVNFLDIKQELEIFIASRPDADRWTQFFASSSGQITVDLIAAFATYLKYDSISSRRENYLAYAQTRAGIIGGGQNLGYSSDRGRNALIDITFTPSSSGTLAKWHVLGNILGIPLVLLNETVVNTGVPITVQTVVGDILTETLQAQTSKSATFRFTTKRVSSDVEIYIGAQVIPGSGDIEVLLDDEFFLQTNVLGSVDAKFLNRTTATAQYTNGVDVMLRWIELNDLAFTESDVSLDETEGTLVSLVVTKIYSEPEVNSSIQINAPLANETKYAIRGRNDFSKLLLLANPDFIAAGGRDTSVAAVVEIFALKDDLSIPTTTEKAELLASIIGKNPFGVRPPLIIDPIPNFLDVAITLVLEPGVVSNQSAEIRTILGAYEKKLSSPEEGQIADFIEIEKQMTDSDSIKISRIRVKAPLWAAGETIKRGEYRDPLIVLNAPHIYEAISFVRYSGATEPTWPVPVPQTLPLTGFIYGQTVIDNSIVWTTIAEDNTLDEWTPDAVYRLGAKVKHTSTALNEPPASFIATELIHKSGLSIIASSATITIQTVIFTAVTPSVDGNVIFLTFNGTDTIDTVVNAWNLANPTIMVGFTGQPGATVLTADTADLVGGSNAYDAEPVWPTPALLTEPDSQSFSEDNQLLWLMVEKAGTPATWITDTDYEIGDTIVPSAPTTGQANIMFQAVTFIGKTKSGHPPTVFPIVFGETVIDGEVEWITRDRADGPKTPGDNEYYLISETIVVS